MEEMAVLYRETAVQVNVVVGQYKKWCCTNSAELYTEQARVKLSKNEQNRGRPTNEQTEKERDPPEEIRSKETQRKKHRSNGIQMKNLSSAHASYCTF
jgi:hypothetical protein